MKIKLLIVLGILSNISSCQDIKTIEKKTKNQVAMENKQISNKDNDIKIALEKQLNEGYKEEIVELGEMKALFEVESALLKNNGYKELTYEQFKEKIKLIFKKNINETDDFIYFEESKPCYLFSQHTWKNLDLKYLFLQLKYRFISDLLWLPEMLDYQKEYPELYRKEVHLEGTDYRLWKDIDDLPKQRRYNQQLLIARNKYLFNDDQSQFSWLINNDEYFIESLVTTFGYTKDQKLLKWVMEKNYKQAEDFVKNNVFVKDCQNKLEIREDILKYIEETTTEQKTDYIEALYRYAYFLFNPYNDKETSIFNEKEKTKIFAYAANTYDQSFRKYSFLGTTNRGRWNMLGSYYYYDSSKEEWENFKKEMALNNYYNLPNLKSLIEYAEEFDGVGSPD